jgi:hypothetical protein
MLGREGGGEGREQRGDGGAAGFDCGENCGTLSALVRFPVPVRALAATMGSER